jgi:NAD/NADP transhydrogenase beta subunit
VLIDFVIIAILILGIWQFRTPRGARGGNLTAAFAMLCALGVVWYAKPVLAPATVVLALVVGGTVGCLVAMRVNMIQIPAMVAFQHGAGGIAAFITSFVELTRDHGHVLMIGQFSGVLGIIIGAATFSGSLVASAKLAGVVRQTPTIWPKHNGILAVNLIAIIALGVFAATAAGAPLLYGSLALILLSILLGVVFAVRIGGADMPVLISFLNATAGLAASFCGIIIENRLLVACGATVAASGSILTHVMCQAMNRNLLRVFVPAGLKLNAVAEGIGQIAAAPEPSSVAAAPAESSARTPLSRAVEAARSAKKVIIIPGYGMALAHAQFEVVKVANRLSKMGKEVKFAIHPIAGRMPGHMHVLLAEADADSDMLFDLPEINAEFQAADLALIVGACDVVNPAAIKVEGTPISGMPILAAYEAKQILVCNLDDRPGYSGVQNALYTDPKTILLLGDARATLSELLQGL